MSFTLPVRDPCRACSLYSVSNAATGFCSQCQEDFDDERASLSDGIAWFEGHFGVVFERDIEVDVDLSEFEMLSDETIGQAEDSLSRYREGSE